MDGAGNPASPPALETVAVGPDRTGPGGLFTAGVFGLVLIGAASVRSPGDGSSVLNVRAYFMALLAGELLTAGGCIAAAVLAWRLNRGKVAAGLAVVLLSLWLGALSYGML